MSATEKKCIKRTNISQFEKLVELMEGNPDIAKGLAKFGSSRSNIREYWDQFAVELNILGPPIRRGQEWLTVWLDYKLKLKKKIANNKTEVVGTGGGPYLQLSLSPLEQSVDALLSLQQAVHPSGSFFGPAERRRENGSTIDNLLEEVMNESQSADDPITVHVQETPLRTRNTPTGINSTVKEDERLSILKKQTSNQEELLKTAKEIEKNLKEIARYTRKTFDLKREELVLLKAKEKRKERENHDKNLQHKENLDIKLRTLEIKAFK